MAKPKSCCGCFVQACRRINKEFREIFAKRGSISVGLLARFRRARAVRRHPGQPTDIPFVKCMLLIRIIFQTVGRLTNLFPEQCGAFIDSFLPLLATMLQRSDCCAKVRGHAASALINMLNPTNCDAESLEKYIHPLLAGLLSCLQSAPYEVRSPCLVVLG